MKSKIVKKAVKNKKNKQIRGKSTKIAVTFHKNKPNSKNIKTGVSSFETSKYEILLALRSKKTNPIKPNTKPIQTQLLQRPKLMQSVYLRGIMKNNADRGHEKQSQFKPKQTQS